MPDALSGCLSENCWRSGDKRVSLTLKRRAKLTQQGVYLEQLDGSAVLLLPAQLSHLDQYRQRVTWILGLKTG